ncbi:FAD-binding oxidoreductase [Pseudaestuariivita atlantica]|uniref:FAD-dependent oxidoreductase n=1 Tax=Pseudaestuariivita atlantica TaxID=1317121 RepID=A0A0L1JTH6_9RHOB|nr:FAD-binding oxidoreductase [Pseudaestuariivita atlantica]KNG95045.1 FAD-dependent oxidoreductase [Pseudaestuariivita atlantica]
MIGTLKDAIGARYVLTGDDAAPWGRDWPGTYTSTPLCVARPGSTAEVAAVVRACAEAGVPVVPMSGNTGLTGAGKAEGAVVLSVDRLNTITAIKPDARIAIVGAGVILSALHDAAAEHGLMFPLTLGARGSAMIGGLLGTNAGGSNVLKYGNMRDLCLGLEVVTPTGEVMDLMSELRKDNSGYNLRNLIVGAEGTLGVVTAAVLKLVPQPAAYATAMVAVPALDDALALLNRLQVETGGAVEAFEYMPRAYMERHVRLTGKRPPFDTDYDVNLLVELGATAARDAQPGPDGTVPVVARLEALLAEGLETGAVLDAVVAQNEAQRAEMWDRREDAAEITFATKPFVNNDVALPLEQVAVFLDRMKTRLAKVDPDGSELAIAHLGDGNVHYTAYISRDDKALYDAVVEAVEDVALELGGSFSAEHGVGLSKLNSMARRKDPVALAMMRSIKAALDPKGIMNPGKVLPG